MMPALVALFAGLLILSQSGVALEWEPHPAGGTKGLG